MPLKAAALVEFKIVNRRARLLRKSAGRLAAMTHYFPSVRGSGLCLKGCLIGRRSA